MAQERGTHLRYDVVAGRRCQVDSRELRAERARERPHFDQTHDLLVIAGI
jgi:hypothetical protein